MWSSILCISVTVANGSVERGGVMGVVCWLWYENGTLPKTVRTSPTSDVLCDWNHCCSRYLLTTRTWCAINLRMHMTTSVHCLCSILQSYRHYPCFLITIATMQTASVLMAFWGEIRFQSDLLLHLFQKGISVNRWHQLQDATNMTNRHSDHIDSVTTLLHLQQEATSMY